MHLRARVAITPAIVRTPGDVMQQSIRTKIDELSAAERSELLHELLVSHFRDVEQEECVIDRDGSVVGFLMSVERRDQLIPTDLLDRMEGQTYHSVRKPMEEVLAKIPAPVCG